jgi:hypothetical protein
MDDSPDGTVPLPELVTTEGVNEGSRLSAAEGGPPGPAPSGVRGGGRPGAADQQDSEAVRHGEDLLVVLPPWGTADPHAPSLEQSVEEQRAGR